MSSSAIQRWDEKTGRGGISERHHLWHLRSRRSATKSSLIAANAAVVAAVSCCINHKLQLVLLVCLKEKLGASIGAASVVLHFFQSIHFSPSSRREMRNTLMRILNSHHEEKASIPKALLILAQISIACKELLTSLKQAILIKARIINSDLRTTWAQKVEERFWSKRSRKLEAGGGRKMRVRAWVVSNKLPNCQEFF